MTLQVDGKNSLDIPDASFIRDAEMIRDGMDLVLNGPDGNLVIENYFNAETQPNLVAPNGETLTPELVNSFAHSPAQYAQNLAMNDASPVGSVQEFSGEATVTHMDGSVEPISIGTQIFQGDIVETNAAGAVNIVFIDDTSFAVSEDARLAIDEYVFDPDTQSGSSNFSVLKGVFVFTSGLIGRDDPDDVEIDTPVGSIGIRGTIIMGNIDTGEITVVEGAIVLRDFQGHEVTLAEQFQTAKFVPGSDIESLGVLAANDVGNKFASIAKVSPTLFSSLQDAATEDTMLVASTVEAPEEVVEDAPVAESQPSEEIVIATAEQIVEQTAPAEVVETQALPPLPLPAALDPFTGQTSGLDSKLNILASGSLPLPPPPPVAGMNAPVNTAANNSLPPPPLAVADGNVQPPPLAVTVQTFGILENHSGSQVMVARLTGQFSPNIVYSLVDPDDAYEMRNYDGQSVEIWTQAGVGLNLDREAGELMPTLGFRATNLSGSALIQGPLNILVGNVNENPELMGLADTGVPAQYFEAAEGTNWSLDLRHLFKDIDGDHLSYRLTSGSLASLLALNPGYFAAAPNIDGSGLISGNTLNFNFTNVDFSTLNSNTNFSLEIEAVDGGGLASTVFVASFNIRDAVGAAIPATITGGPFTYSGVGAATDTANIISDGNFVFGNGGNDSLTVTNSNNNLVNAGDGNDTITVGGTGAVDNMLIGGHGNDTFLINGGQVDNQFYGLDGNDTFILDSSSVAQLGSTAFPTALIDGGHGYDTLRLATSSPLNFDAIFDTRGNTLRNIEHIDLNNGSGNPLTIDYTDVLEMTGHDRTLRISRDNVDNVTIDMEGETYVSYDNGDGYTAYQIGTGTGEVTLLVENTAATTSITA